MSRRQQDWEGAPPRLSLTRRLAVMAASALATLAIAVLVFAAWGVWSFTSPGPVAPHGDRTTVILRHGASLPEIAQALEDEGVVRSGSVFVVAAQITGATRALKAGEYSFPSRQPLGQVLEMIRRGQIVRHNITLPEGVTAGQAVAILMDSDALTGSAPVPPEGSILPETYEIQRGEDRAVVLQRMMSARDRLLAQLWPKRRAGLPFATPEQAVILASIVEKETGVASERPRVAAVFVNRLAKGMRLESDPTVIYGITRGAALGRGIRQSELEAVTPYNTYRIAGMPPTPISNPGKASIAAVLDPPDTTELFFVANGRGGHLFSSTIAEHAKNVERWRKIEAARNAGPPPSLAGGPPTGETPQGATPKPLRGEAVNGR